MWTFLFALMAFLGTALQYRTAMETIRDTEQESRDVFAAADELITEVPWWRPVRRFRHRREVIRLLAERPAELARYRRLWRVLMSWTLLSVAAAGATLAPVADAIAQALG
jgi:hypothetical protein